jgi:hypothetical protein
MTTHEVIQKFRSLVAKRDEADELTLALMRHPQAHEVSDKLMDVCDTKLHIHEMMRDAVTRLRAKYPQTKYGMPYPWLHPEFDQYERK